MINGNLDTFKGTDSVHGLGLSPNELPILIIEERFVGGPPSLGYTRPDFFREISRSLMFPQPLLRRGIDVQPPLLNQVCIHRYSPRDY